MPANLTTKFASLYQTEITLAANHLEFKELLSRIARTREAELKEGYLQIED